MAMLASAASSDPKVTTGLIATDSGAAPLEGRERYADLSSEQRSFINRLGGGALPSAAAIDVPLRRRRVVARGGRALLQSQSGRTRFVMLPAGEVARAQAAVDRSGRSRLASTRWPTQAGRAIPPGRVTGGALGHEEGGPALCSA